MNSEILRDSQDKKASKRELSKEKILNAFEKVLVRDGINRLGVNAIMREAGLAKPLLYDYFGDLDGLARTWVSQRGVWPSQHADIEKPMNPLTAGGDQSQIMKFLLLEFAENLRSNPVALEVVAADLMDHSVFGEGLDALREKWSNSLGSEFAQSIIPGEKEFDRFLLLFYPAIVYLALRGRRGIPLGPVKLNEDEGWNKAIDVISDTIDDMARLKKARDAIE